MHPIKTVLLIEDNPGDARLLREMFAEQGSGDEQLTCVESMSEAEKYLAKHSVDIILLDLGLPDSQGLEAIRRAQVAAPRVPLVVLTGLDDEALAAQALREGAQDYLIKGQIEATEPPRDAASIALCHRTKDHGGSAIRGKGTRPGHPQLHRRRRCLHRQFGKYHVPQSGRGKNDRLAVARSGRPTHGGDFPHTWTPPIARSSPTRWRWPFEVDRTMHLPPNCILIRRDGLEIPIEDSVSPIHDHEGGVRERSSFFAT